MFVRHDAGSGLRKWDTGDCSVRALCKARSISYDDAWRLLFALQSKHKACSFKITEFLKREPEAFGHVLALSFPAKAGKRRMTGEEFCKRYPTGSYILRMAHHVVAVRDGRLLDRWDCSQKCVYSAWQFL